jgi:hypothetical protein
MAGPRLPCHQALQSQKRTRKFPFYAHAMFQQVAKIHRTLLALLYDECVDLKEMMFDEGDNPYMNYDSADQLPPDSA